MEKYSNWTDRASGINPFVPLKQKLGLVQKTVGIILLLIRLPVLLCISFVFIILSLISNLIPVWIVRRPIQRYVYALLGRTFLFICGFYHIDRTKFEVQKGISAPRKVKKQSTTESLKETLGLDINHGDIIISNFVSYFDIIYFSFRYAPVFVWPFKFEKTETPKLTVVGPLNALRYLCFGHTPNKFTSTTNALSLNEISEMAQSKKWGPVVFFAEGCTTNGRGILEFLPDFSSASANQVHVFGIRYKYQQFSPSFPVGSFGKHFLYTNMQIANNLTVRRISNKDVPHEEYMSRVRTSMSSVLANRPLSMRAQDKISFLTYWNTTQGTYVK
eukprot:gb/GECH01007947.1/.p1 GENE.gb/GECH01007947.1/~~gb/GECH01007947.1/.p1  ORF type:complete len:331 (+),score=36.12 gb/GECH01007947.1/:1-993(+)